jgi:hypothetical protein
MHAELGGDVMDKNGHITLQVEEGVACMNVFRSHPPSAGVPQSLIPVLIHVSMYKTVTLIQVPCGIVRLHGCLHAASLKTALGRPGE